MRNVALCFAVALLEGYDIQAIGVAAPRMASSLGLGPAAMAWLFFASNLGLLIGAWLGGRLADRNGRKPVFIAAVLCFGAFTILTAWTSTLEPLILVRLVAGLGLGAALPNMIAVASDVSLPARRAFTTTVMFCGVPLGGGIVALLTQLLPAGFDWRTLFIIGGIAPLLLAAALWRWMQETYLPHQTSAIPKMGVVWALFGDGRASATLLLWIAFVPTLMILYLNLYWLPTLVTAKGLGAAVAPQVAIAFNVLGVVGAVACGRLVDRLGARWVLAIVYAAFVIVTLLLSAATTQATLLTLSAGAGFLILGANYSLYGIAASYYPPQARGTGSGAAVGMGRIGSILGPLLPGLFLTGSGSADTILWLLAPAAALAGGAAFILSFLDRAGSLETTS